MTLSTRDLILQHAAQCFAAAGLAATMGEIAQAAGVSRRTLYNHFPTREAVLAALVERQSLAFLAGLRAAVAMAGDFPAFLLDCCCHVIRESPRAPLALMHVGNSAGQAATLLHFRSPPIIEAWLGFFQGPYVEGLRLGQIAPDITLPDLLAWFGRVVTSYLQVPPEALPSETLLGAEEAAAVRTQIDRFFIRALRPA
ncbi:TetR/AcrR family transcriptional regulator [Zavarzinia compransoris]|uniref:HTH tetR-type domain-containing protein n=1 Tax=Zavarzinia compransoris TaxID=1264899 RepID=A0A317E6A6_9PROT|nr:TetR/AcrR family transcriptional regulator [Zavarzinia compransoris]PWR20565.1 hypothetical protein DKG75_11190 [Zavarzinia compransoris]TDP43789.1 TetR family transcriptional regulator [Zavarzinia compransoris]